MTSDEKPNMYYSLLEIVRNKGYDFKEFTEIYWENEKGERTYIYKKEEDNNGNNETD